MGKNDTAFLNNGGDGLFVVDFTDLTSPQIIGSLTDYTDKGYNHSGWPTADMKTYIMADEDWGYDMKVLDISNLSDITEITTFSSEIDPIQSHITNLLKTIMSMFRLIMTGSKFTIFLTKKIQLKSLHIAPI